MCYHFVKTALLLLGYTIVCLFGGCSNSEWADLPNEEDSIAEWEYPIANWEGKEEISGNEDNQAENASAASSSQTASTSSSSSAIKYLPIDDTEYPYAGIPRIVIVTEKYQEIKDRETEIPAKLQIWGENAPESEIMDLTIRGRGNTSWEEMPKKSYKIEFIKKQSLLGMPKDRDWALIANYADKTLMKNYLAYHLSAELGAFYAPRCDFVELYLNKEYLGVYLLTETIKNSSHRVNIPQNDSSYIVEFDCRIRESEQNFHSFVIQNDSIGKGYHIHSPKDISASSLQTIENHILNFETYLKTINSNQDNFVAQWLDINEYIKHYWIQELSKNTDANFATSVYFSWTKGGVIKMGPVWDFDLAFGGSSNEIIALPESWHIKQAYWNTFLFKDSTFVHNTLNFWTNNKEQFKALFRSIDSLNVVLQDASKNNFKRWNILTSTKLVWHRNAYNTYNDAVNDLKKWIEQRISWIDSQLENQ